MSELHNQFPLSHSSLNNQWRGVRANSQIPISSVSRQDQRSVVKCLLFLLLFWVCPSFAQTNGESKILFLHLKVTNQVVTLVDTVTRPGVLKGPREPAADDLRYEMLSVTGKSLWKGAVADPRMRHLEYEDPPGSGNLKRKTVYLDEVEFMVRVPIVSKARQIDFFKLAPSVSGVKVEKQGLSRQSLGSVFLP